MCNVMGWKIEEFTGNDNNSAVDNPINAQYTDYIMSMDITDAQKILLLRELVALKVREVNNLQQIIEAQKQTIEALQGRLAG